MNVLDDDVLCSIRNAKTFATNHTFVTDTYDGLVGAQVNGRGSGGIVSDLNTCSSSSSVAVRTPIGVVGGVLPSIARAFVGCGTATSRGGGTFGALKVELPVQDNTSGGAIGEPGLQLSDRRRDCACRTATPCGTFGEALRCALDRVCRSFANGCGTGCIGRRECEKEELHGWIESAKTDDFTDCKVNGV